MADKSIKHTKSSGGIVVNKKDQIIVINECSGAIWSLPKGHIETGENELDAAKREIFEESGITDLEVIKNLGDYQRFKLADDGSEDKSELKTIVMFLFKTSEEILKPIDSENLKAKWIEKNEVADLLTHPQDKEFFLRVKQEI